MEFVLEAKSPVCDFCSSDKIVKRYECVTFVMDEQKFDAYHLFVNSRDDWAACAECSKLIEAGDREALAKRSVDTYCKQYRVPSFLSKDFTGVIKKLHDAFWEHRLPS